MRPVCSGFYSDADSQAADRVLLRAGITSLVDRRTKRNTDADSLHSFESFLAKNSGRRGFAARPDANLHAVTCRTVPNR